MLRNIKSLLIVLIFLFPFQAQAQFFESAGGSGGGGGTGTVTDVSVATANGFSGTVANSTTTPLITISASSLNLTSLSLGNGTLLTTTNRTGTGNLVLNTSPTIASPTITGAFTATGLVTNADLVNAATTVNGTTCTLGSTCTVTGAPSGSAGGSLKGTYPNPGLADVNSIATSLAIGGATIGSNALAVTGTVLFNTALGPASGGTGQSSYTKGDLLTTPGSTTINKLAVGSDGQVLTADAASTNGVKWAAAGGSSTLTANSTATSGFSAGNILMSDGSNKLQIGTNINATSLALGSATIGTNKLAVTGTSSFSGAIAAPGGITSIGGAYTGTGAANDGLSIGWTNSGFFAIPSGGGYAATSSTSALGTVDTVMSRSSAGVWQMGTSTTLNASGSLLLTNITASGAAVILSGLSTDAAATDTTLCSKSSDGTVLKGSGTLGICLGTSSIRYKSNVQSLTAGLPEILSLKAKSFYLDAKHGNPNKLMYGFTAEDCAIIIPALTGMDTEGKPNTCDYLGVVPILVHAIQQQQTEINNLKQRLN